MYLLIIVFITICFANQSRQQLFSSVADFDLFLEHEKQTLVTLENFLDWENERIKLLKKFINAYNKTLNNGFTLGVDNPVHFYLVMKDVIQKWNSLETFLSANVTSKEDVIKVINDERVNRSIQVPMEADLNVARVAISRVQTIYKLKHEDLVAGKINGKIKTKLKLDAYDCYTIGKVFAEDEEYNNTYLWMEQALIQLDREKDHQTVDRLDVLKYFAFASFKRGMSNKSVEILSEFIRLAKDDESFYRHIRLYAKKQTTKIEPNYEATFATNTSDMSQIEEEKQSWIYENLCNGEKISHHKSNPSLMCYYKKDRPFLRLASFKVEMLNIKPDIFLFHNVISDEEISIITNISKVRLQQAQVVNEDLTNEPSRSRTAKTDWLGYQDHDILETIDKRIEDMTNLDADYAEPLQMAHYDVGGHYNLHYDSFGAYDIDESRRLELDDRIATVLFYLSTPDAGGATVFSRPRVALFPEKNCAILWYNLLKSGKPDANTIHAGCPVLSGKKWIANKWIRERGQEFRRTCSTNPDE